MSQPAADAALEVVDDAPTRGRPRSDDRTAAILEAARDVLGDNGWEAFRVQDVADRAGAGLATIYRRWSTKEELVAAAIESKLPDPPTPTGDPQRDLRDLIESLAAEIQPTRRNFIGMIAAAQQHDVIREVVDAQLERVRSDFTAAVEAAIGRADARAATIGTAIPGMLMLRSSVLDEAVDPVAFADEVLALVDALR